MLVYLFNKVMEWILTLAVKNIQASLIFLARLIVYLQKKEVYYEHNR